MGVFLQYVFNDIRHTSSVVCRIMDNNASNMLTMLYFGGSNTKTLDSAQDQPESINL